MSLHTLFLVPLLLFSSLSAAGGSPAHEKDATVRLFVAGGLERITAARQGQPFVLVFWSIDCVHCPRELKTLGELKKRQPHLDIVLVAADTPESASRTARIAGRFGLGRVEQWVFADDMPERLRFQVDPNWHGELPRTYFYDRTHHIEAVSGIVPENRLNDWIATNVR